MRASLKFIRLLRVVFSSGSNNELEVIGCNSGYMRAATAIYFTCADFQKRRFQSVLEKTSFLVKFSHSAYDLFSVIKPKTKAVHTTQRLFMLPHIRQTETIRYKKSFLKWTAQFLYRFVLFKVLPFLIFNFQCVISFFFIDARTHGW